ncbi:aldehyde dehydrogenase family protein [Streptomyces sp. SLBN-118]|uniref:aldehyde dehydrogenase family protein n=1 Tax=Streptomyces sp. SLBN-118 TaxID=2768454 RepID=UPI001150F02C|nr:aldehyde dehydrogenase family protein [Streptomyces sp. SLBN-118]TQK50460.1 aldehyde dehydrogenase family protein [Streptomyces sp. SLBN-118]
MPDLFIGGQWSAAVDGQVREIRCPADGTLVATVDEAGSKDAAAAIAAARDAFDRGPWPATPAAERGRLLLRVADLLERDKDALARAESLDTGKRLVESEYDMDDIAGCFRYFGSLTGSGGRDRVVDTGNPDADSRVVHEPVGVCALITPWNYPLLQTAWKVAPALGAGNTFVLKPSELTPHTAVILMRLLSEAGLPDGVANLVLSVVRDESFGPVLTVETFRDDEEAVALANDTVYGLAGAVWSQDVGRAHKVASRIRAGTVWINDFHPYVPQAEWGGMKQSGFGRELGPAGLAEYQEAKHIWRNLAPRPQRWFA